MMRSGWNIFIAVVTLMSLIDVSLYFSFIKTYTTRKLIKIIHLSIYLSFVVLFLVYTLTIPKLESHQLYFWFSKMIAIFILIYLPKTILLLCSIVNLLFRLFGRLFFKSPLKTSVINTFGLFLSTFLFLNILYGFTLGRYKYKVRRIEISAENLPISFDNYKIIHITDLHLGSYGKSYKGLDKAVNIINSENPDIVVFTGDMVNNFSEEIISWKNQLSEIKAKDGKYSILGNHDYGSYVDWKDEKSKADNLSNLIKYERECGFNVLIDTNMYIRKDSDSIVIAGVQNWSKPPFPQIGDLDKAINNISDDDFTILLSHDPNHWEAEVLQRKIELTLSGHTHAMQMGIECCGIKWSPAKYIYKYWDGLYHQNGRYLNVNRGIGYVGLPGRIGLRPEITIITLKRS